MKLDHRRRKVLWCSLIAVGGVAAHWFFNAFFIPPSGHGVFDTKIKLKLIAHQLRSKDVLVQELEVQLAVGERKDLRDALVQAQSHLDPAYAEPTIRLILGRDGECLDRWGTDIWIRRSSHDLELVSAGPNQRLDDGKDDIVFPLVVGAHTLLLHYDNNGNLTSDACSIYTWDADNRLTQMAEKLRANGPARQRLAFTYDSQSRRVQKVVEYFQPGTTNQGQGTWQLAKDCDSCATIGT